MHARQLTFTNSTGPADALAYLRDDVLPVLNGQHGFMGVSASFDEARGVIGLLSLWATEDDLAASDGALVKARQEAARRVEGDVVIETFEQVVETIAKSPTSGSVLVLMKLRMPPGLVDEYAASFESDVLPRLDSQPGFCEARNLVNRQLGRATARVTWEDDAAWAKAEPRMPQAWAATAAKGFAVEEVSVRTLLLFEAR
jgi:hypothetical protein